jgi:predicted nuclease with TOPRIM domain
MESLASRVAWLNARIERLEERLPRLDAVARGRLEERLKDLKDRRDLLSARWEHLKNFGWALGSPLSGAEFSYEAMKDSVNRAMTHWM